MAAADRTRGNPFQSRIAKLPSELDRQEVRTFASYLSDIKRMQRAEFLAKWGDYEKGLSNGPSSEAS